MLALTANRREEVRMVTANGELSVFVKKEPGGRILLLIDAPRSVSIYRAPRRVEACTSKSS